MTNSFDSIMYFANRIMDSKYPRRIYDFIYTLGKAKQFQRIQDCITGVAGDNYDAEIKNLFIEENLNVYQYSFYKMGNVKSVTDKYCELDPSEYLVFAYPWESSRLMDAFLQIGENVGKKWVHDPMNHRLDLVTPLNIGIINNGNHSAAMNIITNESLFKVTQVMDLSPIYDEIYTNGHNFMYISNDTVIGKATSVEMAAIFEIGREIQKRELNKLPT